MKKKRDVAISINGSVNGNIIIGDKNDVGQNTSKSTDSNDIFFDVGHRLKQVREEIEVQSSQFFELLGLPSERQYLTMETRKEEVPLGLLEKVHELTGVELEWLKHGEEPRYKVEISAFRTAKQGIEFVAQFRPKNVYFVLGKPDFFGQWLTCIIVQVGDYCFQIIDLKTGLDFWNWVEDFWFIPIYIEYLSVLRNAFPLAPALALSGSWYRKLLEGKIHFFLALRNADMKFRFWPDAVLDVNCQYQTGKQYESQYGKWITKMRGEYHAIDAQIAKNQSKNPKPSWLNVLGNDNQHE
ncbi:MAG: hypothetical protein CVU44_12980 [Chloroflexi bacterium HGW-Chloroflexi-6]|nr:MAG: hypothetical protein CVU44_12980 [Chloroflexi bacterium HGW-Chloroflexi-6]